MSLFARSFFPALNFEEQSKALLTEEMQGVLGVFVHLSFDTFEESVEFNQCLPDMRLPEEAQHRLWDLGFKKARLNHVDGWETGYSKDRPEGNRYRLV